MHTTKSIEFLTAASGNLERGSDLIRSTNVAIYSLQGVLTLVRPLSDAPAHYLRTTPSPTYRCRSKKYYRQLKAVRT